MSVIQGKGVFKTGNSERPGIYGLTESERSFFKKALWEGCRESAFIGREMEEQFLAWVQKTEESGQALTLIRLGARMVRFSPETGEVELLIPKQGTTGFEKKVIQI